jgi:hypothetical protein
VTFDTLSHIIIIVETVINKTDEISRQNNARLGFDVGERSFLVGTPNSHASIHKALDLPSQ